jgi:hypothetical protein
MLCASRFVLLSTGAADQITFAALFVEEGIDETDFPLTSKQKPQESLRFSGIV